MEYRTLKLCSYRRNGVSIIAPSGAIVEIDDDAVEALTDLGAIEELEAPADAPVEEVPMDDLDADAFAAWLASGAKVGQVVDWIGTDLDRAEIAMADERATVKKHVEALAAGDD